MPASLDWNEHFTAQQIAVDGVTLNVRMAGSGPALLLIHGYPQTHLIWRKVAPLLAEHFTVVAPDMRGYGDSDAPASRDGEGYSKRVIAAELRQLMHLLGHQRFCMALDHDCVDKLSVLDIIPTLAEFERMGQVGGLSSYHWYFLAQPEPFSETLIGADAEYFLRHTINSWCGIDGSIDEAVMQDYVRCFSRSEVIHATCEDYRAGATTDCQHDAADRAGGRRITCPVLALWGGRGLKAQRGSIADIWRDWADNVEGEGLDCGHFLPEEKPAETAQRLKAFLLKEKRLGIGR